MTEEFMNEGFSVKKSKDRLMRMGRKRSGGADGALEKDFLLVQNWGEVENIQLCMKMTSAGEDISLGS